MTSPSAGRGFLYVCFSICIWSGWIVASRFAIKGTLTSYDVTAIRFAVSGVILLPVVLRKGLSIGPRGLASGFLLALLVGAPYTNIAVAGMHFAPASHAATLINGSMLLFTTLVGIHGLKEPTSRLRVAGVFCSIAGIGVLLLAKNASPEYSQQWIGHLLFMLSGIMWGGYAVLVRAWKAEAIHAAAVVCVFSLMLYLPLYLCFAPSHIGWGNWHEVAFQGVYQGIFTAVLALIAFNAGIGILGASKASSLLPLVPVLATLLAIPVLHEVPSFAEWTGIAAVSLGVLFASGVAGHQLRRLKP